MMRTTSLIVSELKLWNGQELCSFLCTPSLHGGAELIFSTAWLLYHAGLTGFKLSWAMIRSDDEEETRRSENALIKLLSVLSLEKPHKLELELSETLRWATKLGQQNPNREYRVELKVFESFSVLFLHNNFYGIFKKSMEEWKRKIEDETVKQQKLLGAYFKTVFLPDRLEGFNRRDYCDWTGYFDSFRFPENKGDELRTRIVTEFEEFRFPAISFIDGSASGKTYTVFNLAHSNTEHVKRFFVVYLYPSTRLFASLTNSLNEVKTELAVGLFCLASHLLLNRILCENPELDPVEFLKFLRNRGDEQVIEIFNTLKLLVSCGCLTESKLEDLVNHKNLQLTKFFQDLGSKVVFAFDEANNLTSYGRNSVKLGNSEKGNLFHAICKVISRFTNPLFVGTTFQISDETLICLPGVKHIQKFIIGTVRPWYSDDISLVLQSKFKLDYSNNCYDFSSLCHSLSGYPEYVTMFHRLVLDTLQENNNQTVSEVFRICLEKVIKTKELNATKRIRKLMNHHLEHEEYTKEELVLTICQLLFGGVCKIPLTQESEPQIQLSKIGKAFIETSFAPVVKDIDSGGYQFDIVDPISFKTYFEILFDEYRDVMWKYLALNLGNMAESDVSEYFLDLLIKHPESISMRKSKLFSKSPTSFDSFSLNSFVKWKMRSGHCDLVQSSSQEKQHELLITAKDIESCMEEHVDTPCHPHIRTIWDYLNKQRKYH